MTEHKSQELNLETLKSDIDKLRSELTDLVQRLTNTGKDRFESVKDDGSKVGKKGIGAIQRQVKEKPLISLFIVVLGLGLLVAKLLRGKSEN